MRDPDRVSPATLHALGEALEGAGVVVDRPIRATLLGRGVGQGTWRIDAGALRCFLKLGPQENADRLECEADGLAALADAAAVRVPGVIACGRSDDAAFLLLEWLDLSGPADWPAFGRRLATLHRSTGDRHGWHRDNYIGASPQRNVLCADWPAFFRDHRLGFQLELARHNRLDRALCERGACLQERIDDLLGRGVAVVPSLLHGDLWSGNAGFVAGEPVLFDPAVHWGDRVADLAMIELFGGFPRAFHQAYQEAWPLPQDSGLRLELYKLYHVLNHANIFGGGYVQQALSMIEDLLAQT